jgi:hypothetical protein
MGESSSTIGSVSPHGTAMEILQERYNEEHPYRSFFSPLTYEDVKKDPELAKQYQEIVDTILKAQSGNADSSSASCPLQGKNGQKENPNCKASTLRITKAGRKFDLINSKADSDRKNEEPESIIEVVGGWKLNPAKMESELTGLVNNCSTHKDTKTWNIPFSNTSNLTPSRAEIKCASEGALSLLPWNASPKIYKVNGNTCSKSFTSYIHVYPDIEVDLGVSIDLSGEETEVSEDRTSTEFGNTQGKKKNRRIPVTTKKHTDTYEVFSLTQGITFAANYKKDGVQISFKQSFTDTINSFNRIATAVEGVNEFVKKVTGDKPGGVNDTKKSISDDAKEKSDKRSKELQGKAPKNSFSITYPNLTFTLGGKWEEMEGDYRVDCAGTVELAANPLIKIGIKKDITQYILQTFPIGAAINKVKDFLRELEIEALALYFEMSGELSGKVKHYAYAIQDSKTEGELSLKIPISITAVLLKTEKEIKHRWSDSYVLKVEIDASLKGESGVQFDGKLSENKQTKSLILEVSGQFLGIEVSVTAVVNTSIGAAKPKKPDGYERVEDREKESNKDSSGGGLNYKNSIYKMEPIPLFKKVIKF